jgi:hypothetical protein
LLSEFVGELPGCLHRIAVDPGGLLDAGEEHQVRVCNREALQAIRQTSLLPDKVLHQSECRRAECVILLDAIYLGRLRHTGTANSILVLK